MVVLRPGGRLGVGVAALLRRLDCDRPLGRRVRVGVPFARAPPPGPEAARERRWRAAAGIAGILGLWIALDWPVGALGAGYLASVHMVQYILISLVIPPFLLIGVPPAAYARLSRRPAVLRVVRGITHPALALVAFDSIAILTHVPRVVDTLMRSQAGSFAIDMAWLATGLLFWWPVMAPVPQREGFPPPLQILYLFVATLPLKAISIILIFSRFPLYATYELAPPTGWISALGDQVVAGGLMMVVGNLIVWGMIAVVFFRWMGRDPGLGAPARPIVSLGARDTVGAFMHNPGRKL